MATERGWWDLNVNTELCDCDREHIARMVQEGYTSGEICECTCLEDFVTGEEAKEDFYLSEIMEERKNEF